jgi:hypothetical protein
MTQFYLAQINIAKIIAPLDSPIMADFTNNLDRINGVAEASDGFVWRLKDENNNATSIKIFEDEFIIVNMSVWKNIESLTHYVYKSDHIEFFKRREEWFHKMPVAHMTLWYIPSDHTPSSEEGKSRLEYLREHGDTPYAFSFRKRFTIEEYLKSSPSSIVK